MTIEQKQTAGVAVASLILGILGFFCLGPLGSIPAIICGHIGRAAIKKKPDTLQGSGMALAGLIMGYIQVALLVVALPLIAILIPAVVSGVERAGEMVCIHNMQEIDSAKDQWAIQEDKEAGSAVETNAVNQYLMSDTLPVCPQGGAYAYNPVAVPPACSVHGPVAIVLTEPEE